MQSTRIRSNRIVPLVGCALSLLFGAASSESQTVDVAFVVDDTGSMSQEINGVKEALDRIIDDAAGSGLTFQLTTFKDDVTMFDPTSDLNVIRSQIDDLVALGGGDCPEASVEALLEAEPQIRNGGRVFIATDASLRPESDLEAAIERFQGRGIRADTILTGDCFSTSSLPSLLGPDFKTLGGDLELPQGMADPRLVAVCDAVNEPRPPKALVPLGTLVEKRAALPVHHAKSDKDLLELELFDDDFVAVELPFLFSIGGIDHDTAFVNANGYVSFGVGEASIPFGSFWLRSSTGQPSRIVPFGVDLFPAAGGSIRAGELDGNFVIEFEEVPDFFGGDVISFTLTLRPDSTFAIEYGIDTTSTRGIVGVAAAGGLVDPESSDLSAAIGPIESSAGGLVYEDFYFTGRTFDLPGLTLEFAPASFDAASIPFAPFISTSARDGLRVFFTGFSSGIVTDWDWDFGDGATATGRITSHVFAAEGVYPVQLTVGREGASSAQVEIDFELTLLADFGYFNSGPNTVTFVNRSSGDISSQLWEFGDGMTSTADQPEHTYADSGVYEVRLTVSNGVESSSATAEVSIANSAVNAFSQLADTTGGLFTFFPEVNTGTDDGQRRFENRVYNLVTGALGSSVALLQPSSAPAGSSAVATLYGAGTSFQEGLTEVTVAGEGVSATVIDVRSPTELAVRFDRESSAAIGDRDVFVRTPLSSDSIEEVAGVGSLVVDAAVVDPQVTGVTPFRIERGWSGEVTVTGINTSFSPSSSVDFGPGVGVDGIVSSRSDELVVAVSVDAEAIVGFRDVIVTTGEEVAIESETGPLFVASMAPVLPSLESITPSFGSPGSAVDVVVFGLNTGFAEGSTELTVGGSGIEVMDLVVISPTELQARLGIATDAELGSRDVFVTAAGANLALVDGFVVRQCVTGDQNLCLQEERFRVEVEWRDFEGAEGSAKVVPVASADSGLLYFFDETNWEMLIKVLDGCALNGHYWVFAAATTNVEYTMTVTDTLAGSSRRYRNELGTASPAITDAGAFATCAVEVDDPIESLESSGDGLVSRVAPINSVRSTAEPQKSLCVAGSEALCLQDGRFRVSVEWQDFEGAEGVGTVVPYGTTDSGLFQFFSPDNWEILVKVLDGCAFNDRVWVFAAATTDVEYSLTVTDSETGETRSYLNPLGVASAAITDTDAFAACP